MLSNDLAARGRFVFSCPFSGMNPFPERKRLLKNSKKLRYKKIKIALVEKFKLFMDAQIWTFTEAR